jgi:GMP synthase (glutamine-hydrolysing)
MDVQRVVLTECLDSGWLLGQGTIYPDVIESGPGTAAKIKTHHNQCEEVQELIRQGRVLEPLRDLYKDQVRQIGHQLGIPKRFVERWPFPGPGLAIRCLCTREESPVVEIGQIGPYECVRVPLRSVGVQGDARTYRTTMAVRGPMSKPELTEFARQHPDDRVILHLAGDVDLKAGTVVPATLTDTRIATLSEADYIVRAAMIGKEHLVWQLPVVLIPRRFRHGESIVLRPVQSRDGMTADFVLLPEKVMKQITDRLIGLWGVDAVFLDFTSKPPSTIEWE